jgi:dTDP-4-dehydrorhamnose reductase
MTNIELSNALITGGSGMVGSQIKFGYKPTSAQMDITNKTSIQKYIDTLPTLSCIIHLAATNLRESENNVQKAIQVNINGTANMLFLAKKYNIPFILVSTGAVFSSNSYDMIFDEKCDGCPNSVYGYTKSSSEQITLLYEKSIVIRTGWLFGGNQKNHYKFVENVINNFITNTEIKASNDFIGSPTYVNDFIAKMIYLINNLEYGIHHVVNTGFANGYEIANEIALILNKHTSLIKPFSCDKIPYSGPYRSNSEMLDTRYEFNKMRSWKDSLKEYCLKYYHSKVDKPATTNHDIIPTIDKKWRNRDNCRLCNSFNLQVFYNLNPTPPANHFVLSPAPQEQIPLDIAICTECSHIQLVQIVNPEFLYSNYLYVSSTSMTMTNHLKSSVLEFTKILDLKKDDPILEIGANDGTCIQHLLDNGFNNVVGVDPAENINNRHNLPIICDFFGSSMIPRLTDKYNKFKLIYAFHCCAHIENIQDVFFAISNLLHDNGVFIMEVGYFYEVFKNNCFDTIYHEHIDYHTCTPIRDFSLKNGLLLFDVKTNPIQGGSIQLFFSKNNSVQVSQSVYDIITKEKETLLHDYHHLSRWKVNILKSSKDLNYILNGLKMYGKTIVGYGASAKSTTFLYQCNVSNKLVDYIIDDNVYKQNYFSPGIHIPIYSIETLNIKLPDYIIILSWNFTTEILKKLEKFREVGVRIIVPFPEIKII